VSTYFRYNPDGTAVYQQVGRESVQVADPARVGLSPGKWVDDLTALQIGLWYILDQVEFSSVDRRSLIIDGVAKETKFRFGEIALDHPDTTDTMASDAPIVTIMARDETELQLAGPLSEQQLLEETANYFAPGTILQKLYESNVTLDVICWLTNKDDRAAVRKGVISAMAREPMDSRAGRRAIIGPYYERLAIYDLQSVMYVDEPDSARASTYPIIFKVASSIEVVDLVAIPEEFKARVCLETGVGLPIDDCD
jgi:hypothetical protein